MKSDCVIEMQEHCSPLWEPVGPLGALWPVWAQLGLFTSTNNLLCTLKST